MMSEVLTGAIDPAAESLHLTPRFAGIFLLALVGNAAEILNAVRFARKDQMDLAIGVTAGASAQGLVVIVEMLSSSRSRPPQEGTGSGMPSPSKPRLASANR